jgi:uncharacterized membrane protein
MSGDGWSPYGAAAGAVAVALFVAAALVMGERPAFDAPAAEVAAHFDENRTRIQVHCALIALSAPFWVWFLSTVASPAGRAGAVAFGCGLTFLTLFLVDVTTLAVGALRPENMTASPELAVTLRDVEFLLMGMAAFVVAGMLLAFAVLPIWPRWLARLAALAAVAYSLRLGTLFTTEGAFAADGVLGLYVPASAFASWIFLASAVRAYAASRASPA